MRFKLGPTTHQSRRINGRPTTWILRPNRPAYNDRALGLTSSRLPNIHLSKSSIKTAANHLRFGVVISFPVAVASGQGRRILASPPSLSIGVAKNFSALRGVDQPPHNHRLGTRFIVHTFVATSVGDKITGRA